MAKYIKVLICNDLILSMCHFSNIGLILVLYETIILQNYKTIIL